MRVGGRSQREGRRAVVRAQLRWRGGPRAGGALPWVLVDSWPPGAGCGVAGLELPDRS